MSSYSGHHCTIPSACQPAACYLKVSGARRRGPLYVGHKGRRRGRRRRRRESVKEDIREGREREREHHIPTGGATQCLGKTDGVIMTEIKRGASGLFRWRWEGRRGGLWERASMLWCDSNLKWRGWKTRRRRRRMRRRESHVAQRYSWLPACGSFMLSSLSWKRMYPHKYMCKGAM